jgi:hypothetical protein
LKAGEVDDLELLLLAENVLVGGEISLLALLGF